jgi:hypothetical protein
MASIVLTAAASALTSSSAPAIAAAVTGGAKLIGGFVDNSLFQHTELPAREGARLDNLWVQSSAWGKTIPILYGKVRIAGNVIWSRPIRETATTTTASSGGKAGGGKVSQSSTSYSYSVTMAIAICEGPIDAVERIWADSLLLDLSQGTYRIYTGTETQLPDSLIAAFEGEDHTPAYRGLAYVVVEDFPLAAFGNRIPNFTFEVRKKVKNTDSVEESVRSITLIPGSGEFVYDTTPQFKVAGGQVGTEWVPQGTRIPINSHHPRGDANLLLALDQMAETFPNLEWVSVVCNWFGTSIDAGSCQILPGVEFRDGAITEPDSWSVAGYTRETAHAITLSPDGSPVYGGTPDDASVLRLLAALRDRGYQILFYPMPLMDTSGKPWRGRILASNATEVASFFNNTDGYNDFIIHYTNLVAGAVDGFMIGSELVGLTSFTDSPGSYPAVDQLVSLAASVKAVLGSSVTVSYGADWSEYHHATGGWYHLDPLWASPDMDVIGIDAYFPLTDAPQSDITLPDIVEGWNSGEGYEWIYTDEARTTKASLTAAYAWKNIAWWWSHTHTNPDSSVTDWVPESKPIWFTEYGFPSVDGATNQPNVFYDPESVESFFPRFSHGVVDAQAQRMGIEATEQVWQDSSMVERRFLWTWDARPFPYWPDLKQIWADGGNWRTGHWVQGKLGLSDLAAVVRDLCLKAGIPPEQIDVSRLNRTLAGFVITERMTIQKALEQLQTAYFFDLRESDGFLQAIPRGQQAAATFTSDDTVSLSNGQAVLMEQLPEINLPRSLDVVYLSPTREYQPTVQRAMRTHAQSETVQSLPLSVVFSDQEAHSIAEMALYLAWTARTRYRFQLPASFAALDPGDVVTWESGGGTHQIRIRNITLTRPGVLELEGTAEDHLLYQGYHNDTPTEPRVTPYQRLSDTVYRLLDLPLLSGEDTAATSWKIASCGRDVTWAGAAIYRAETASSEYQQTALLQQAAVMGSSLTLLPPGPSTVVDEASSVTISLLQGELASVSEEALLSGANAALLGQEVLQFRDAVLLEPYRYQLRGLLRGRLGTEDAIATHQTVEPFVLLDSAVVSAPVSPSSIGLPRFYKAITIGGTLSGGVGDSHTYHARALKPYAPVHVRGERDGSGNLSLYWVRRTRSGGAWRDLVDIPLAEESERYEVDIMNGSIVVRTLTSTTPLTSYSAANQISDFGSVQSSLTIRVYQLSAMVGRGIAAQATV